ncbi:hypothetical protein JRO89_XS14G0004400 [Xanthoceras sorbifolium]|uniref:ABC transporter domain-containing protein n=1 Tax=Xanthoceras sorbifolium TaxID=99658 RepID=A0ABQ8H319_9ROSI|nr:hypothetical protein JRO89_XS14G0004400 [Xanthoceras sorbifolium]
MFADHLTPDRKTLVACPIRHYELQDVQGLVVKKGDLEYGHNVFVEMSLGIQICVTATMATVLPCTHSSSFSFSLKFRYLPSNTQLITPPTICPLRLCSKHCQSFKPIAATLSTVDSPLTSSTDGHDEKKKPLLKVTDLRAAIVESKQEILKGVNLLVNEGEVSSCNNGKEWFWKEHPFKGLKHCRFLLAIQTTEVTGGSVIFKGENLLEMEPEERSLAGLFMSFQSPVEIPGVSNIDFLHMAYNAQRRKLDEPELGPIEFYAYVYPKLELVNMKTDFLNRNVNEGFSGGERKRNEILQLAVLGAELAILDEIDSGLDVDALRDIAKAVNGLLTPKNSVLMITHYRRLLEFIKPRFIHIMDDGRIIKTGDLSIAKVLEEGGYKAISDT